MFLACSILWLSEVLLSGFPDLSENIPATKTIEKTSFYTRARIIALKTQPQVRNKKKRFASIDSCKKWVAFCRYVASVSRFVIGCIQNRSRVWAFVQTAEAFKDIVAVSFVQMLSFYIFCEADK